MASRRMLRTATLPFSAILVDLLDQLLAALLGELGEGQAQVHLPSFWGLMPRSELSEWPSSMSFTAKTGVPGGGSPGSGDPETPRTAHLLDGGEGCRSSPRMMRSSTAALARPARTAREVMLSRTRCSSSSFLRKPCIRLSAWRLSLLYDRSDFFSAQGADDVVGDPSGQIPSTGM